MTATATRIDARTAAYLIANRLAQAGYTEDGVIPAMAADRLPALEVLIDGRRFLVTVEPVPERFQPVTVESVLQGVLF